LHISVRQRRRNVLYYMYTVAHNRGVHGAGASCRVIVAVARLCDLEHTFPNSQVEREYYFEVKQGSQRRRMMLIRSSKVFLARPGTPAEEAYV
jgi:hypothetical protein